MNSPFARCRPASRVGPGPLGGSEIRTISSGLFLSSSFATDAVASVDPSSQIMISMGRCVCAITLSTAMRSSSGRFRTGMTVETRFVSVSPVKFRYQNTF